MDDEKEIKEYMEKFDKLIEEMRALKLKKTIEYGISTEQTLGCRGMFVDLNGVLNRIKRFVWEEHTENTTKEAIRDKYLDMAIYALMSLKSFDEGNIRGKI